MARPNSPSPRPGHSTGSGDTMPSHARVPQPAARHRRQGAGAGAGGVGHAAQARPAPPQPGLRAAAGTDPHAQHAATQPRHPPMRPSRRHARGYDASHHAGRAAITRRRSSRHRALAAAAQPPRRPIRRLRSRQLRHSADTRHDQQPVAPMAGAWADERARRATATPATATRAIWPGISRPRGHLPPQPHQQEADTRRSSTRRAAPRRRRWLIVVALVGSIGVGGGMAYAYKTFLAPKVVDRHSDVRASKEPVKVVPDNPGGKKVGTDNKFNNRLDGEGTNPNGVGACRPWSSARTARSQHLKPCPRSRHPHPRPPRKAGSPA